MNWREMCIQNDLINAISVHRKEEIENRAKLRKIEKCKMTEWVRLLGTLGHQNQYSLPITENYEGTK